MDPFAVRFPSGNQWGIPGLRRDRLGTVAPVGTWSGRTPLPDGTRTPLLMIHRTAAIDPLAATGHVYGWYVDDERFQAIWNAPSRWAGKLMDMALGAVVSPDFSLWRDDPFAVQVFNVWRNRWLARFWQEFDIPVIPNISWSDDRTMSLAVVGIPTRPPLVAIECRTTSDDRGRDLFRRGCSLAIRVLRPEGVLVYGGEENANWLDLPRGPAYTLLPCWRRQERKER